MFLRIANISFTKICLFIWKFRLFNYQYFHDDDDDDGNGGVGVSGGGVGGGNGDCGCDCGDENNHNVSFPFTSFNKDIDECSLHGCQNNGNCTNTLGGFNCTCPGEWHGPTCADGT